MERRKRRSLTRKYIDSLTQSPDKLHQATEFNFSLANYYKRKWNCQVIPPCIQGVPVDLHTLYRAVISFGGWQKVSSAEKWREVARAVGLEEGVAVAEYAVKVLYIRFLSKYEQNELVGEVDDADADLFGSRKSGKGFSSLASADCPVNVSARQDFFRLREKREAEYDRIVKSLLSGLPNEVDFAVNVCTLLSHPGPRVLRLSSAPQIITLLVAHVAIFPDEDSTFYELYKTWKKFSGNDFVAFWSSAGITDEQVLSLIPHVPVSKMCEEDINLFVGLIAEFRPREVVSWRIHQVLSIVRNLSFEIINKAVMASSWPLLKFLFVCISCKWSILRTGALDALSNIACEIDLMSEESSTSNHLLLKLVSQCLHSGDKLQIIRALEILSGLCNNERNESLLCEFLDQRVLNDIFTVIAVKDIMICVYALESLYQISELGAGACQHLATHPHVVDSLVSLATIEAVSFGPTGLMGMKVVEFHGPSQFAPPPPQNLPPAQPQAARPGSLVPVARLNNYHGARIAIQTPTIAVQSSAVSINASALRTSTVQPHTAAVNSTPPIIGESKVDKLTAKWVRMNCVAEVGSVVPRGEVYASYVDDLRHHYNTLSGSMQMFCNIVRAIFPSVTTRTIQTSNSSNLPIFENLKFIKSSPGSTSQTPTTRQGGIVASHPLMQKMLAENTSVNGHLPGVSVAAVSSNERSSGRSSASLVSTATSVSEDASRPGTSHAAAMQPSTSTVYASNSSTGSALPKVCRAAIEARDFMPTDERHEAKIVRVENVSVSASSSDSKSTTASGLDANASQQLLKSAVARRLNGMVLNGETKVNGFGDLSTPAGRTVNGASNIEVRPSTSNVIDGSQPSTSAGTSSRDDDSESTCSSTCATPSPVATKRRRISAVARPSTSSTVHANEYLCEWNGCGRQFYKAASVLHHCMKEHVENSGQCHWPRCDSTIRSKWSMVTHLQDHHCSEVQLSAAAKRRREGQGIPLGPVNPERPREFAHHPGYSKNAAVEAIRRHAFNYLPRDFTDEPEGPVTKSIRLTSCLILRNLARYSADGRSHLRRHERLLSRLALSRMESSSALAQLLAELYDQTPSSKPHRPHVPSASTAVNVHRTL